MIPFFELKFLALGTLRVPIFGLLLVTAILVGRWRILRQAKTEGAFQERSLAMFCLVALIGGLFFAHVTKIALEDTANFLAGPAIIIKSAAGIRSAGALYGGLLTAIVWCRLRGLSGAETLRLLDRFALVLPLSWMIGRLGCALVHDHLGQASRSWMAVNFPDGPRYDLGVIEFVFLIPLTILFWMLDRRARPAGFFFGLFGVAYGGFRAWLDTLQVQPFGWDFAGGMLGVAIGLAGWIALKHYEGRSTQTDAFIERPGKLRESRASQS